MAWAFEQEIPPLRKFVLITLANVASETVSGDTTCYPSYAYLQRMTCMSRRGLINTIHGLVEDGLLAVVNRKQGNQRHASNIYVLAMPPTTENRDAPKQDEACSVYVAICLDKVKIGISTQLKKRLEDLDRNNPEKVKLYGYVETTSSTARKVEKACHEAFAKQATGNEWFDLDPTTTLKAVENMLALHLVGGSASGAPPLNGGVVHGVHHRSASGAPPLDSSTRTKEKSPKPSEKKKNKTTSCTPRQELEKVLDSKHAAAILDHRKVMRRPLSPYAAALLSKNLKKCGDPNAAADYMIERGWQSINPEWMRNGSTQNRKSSEDLDYEIMQKL